MANSKTVFTNAGDSAIVAESSNLSASGNAIWGVADNGGRGMMGFSPQGTGVVGAGHIGVEGDTPDVNGIGVKGFSEVWDGVDGINGDVSGITVNPGWGAGVRGETVNGYGVVGLSGTGVGVRAENNNQSSSSLHAINHAGGPAGRFEGSLQCTADVYVQGDLILTGGDCAERFEVAAGEKVSPGMIMSADSDGALYAADQPYDPGVVGIVSGAGSFKPAITLNGGDYVGPTVKIALIGRAFCKVSNIAGPIKVGDLLTSSTRVGTAMRAERSLRSIGCILGKALANSDCEEDLIPVLVSRQ